VKVFATYNIKGGVGKTTTAVNLAYLSAVEGHRTLLWDLDPQGAASYLLRIKSRVKGGAKALIRGTRTLDDAVKGTDFDNLDLVPADFTYRNMDLELDGAKRSTQRLGRLLRPLRDEYDVIFLDCPPSISLVSENVLHAVNRLLVPLIPTTLSLRTFDQLTGFIAELEEPRPGVLAFFNMVDRRKRLHRTVMAQLSADRRIAQTAIPALSIVEQMAVRRAPLPAFAPKDKAAQSYEALWRELQQQS
jgi:chromosome partitioning protein